MTAMLILTGLPNEWGLSTLEKKVLIPRKRVTYLSCLTAGFRDILSLNKVGLRRKPQIMLSKKALYSVKYQVLMTC
jgi:hypothetical protein